MTDQNPLQKYYRQPSIYIKLPSKGRFYSPEAFEPTTSGEIPVLPMTAKDELNFKTPDAMMNGQATVDVIKSCIPNFKDPWQVVNYDVDTILLAIRIATYGETMDLKYNVPVTGEENSHTINLPALLEDLSKVEIRDEATTSKGFTIVMEPLTYRNLTKVYLANYEAQKMYGALDSQIITDEDKNKVFRETMDKINKVNFSLLLDGIKKIITPDKSEVTDRQQIIEFCNMTDAKTVDEIQKLLNDLRTQTQIPPLKIKATDEQIKKGVSATFEVPLTFDQSNFFA
tara:strand:- start:244 stop:1098 length:855 start_codon:yes stop_codon:yes gene_type:complete